MSYILGPGIIEDKLKNETQNLANKGPSSRTINIINLFFSSFFVTPIVILYWASAWDVLDYLPFSFFTNSLILLFISNFLIFNVYLWQNKLQIVHDKIASDTCLRVQKSFWDYYGCDFLLRCVYTYVVTMAYVMQWVFVLF